MSQASSAGTAMVERTYPVRGSQLLDRFLRRGPVTMPELVGLVLLCAAVVVGAAWALRVPLLLGHDESAYAVLARHWQAGSPDTGVSAHRAPLLSAMGVPVLAAGGGDVALRGIGVTLAAGAALAVWWLARMMAGPIAGLMAATVFALAPTVFTAGTLYLTDLPAAAVLVALTGLLWWQFALLPRPNRLLLLAAPLAWAAYEFRYGSASVVVILFLTTAVVFLPSIRANARLVLESIGLLVLLLLPHLVNSTLDMGTPWERVVYTALLSGREYLGEGLIDYIRWFPNELAGRIAAIFMTMGLVGTPVMWLRSLQRDDRPPGRDSRLLARGLAFVTVPAVGHAVAIGVTNHGEPRFVFFSVALLCTAGAVVIITVLRWLSGRSSAAVWLALSIFAVAMALHLARLAPATAGLRGDSQERVALLKEAAESLKAMSGGDCSVLTGHTPVITWYSGCASYTFGTTPEIGRERNLTEDAWMLLFEEGRLQPEGAVLDHYVRIAEPVRSWDPPLEGRLGSATLYRITTDGATTCATCAPYSAG